MNTEKQQHLIEPTQDTICELKADDLSHWLAYREEPRLIEFYASWCIYHLLTRRKLERLQETLRPNILAGSIDCLGIENQVRARGITQIPTICYYCRSVQLSWRGDTDLEVMLDDIAQAHRGCE